MGAPKISNQQQQSIEIILTNWSGKLTWEALVTKVNLDLGIITTRQTLYSYAGIRKCYTTQKERLRNISPVILTKITASDVTLAQRIEHLEAEIKVLKRNNAEQLRMIERILANASNIPNLDLSALIQKRPEETL